jgi:hypothetical protein
MEINGRIVVNSWTGKTSVRTVAVKALGKSGQQASQGQ